MRQGSWSPRPAPATDIGYRKVDPVNAAAIREAVHLKDILPWFSGAFSEIQAALSAQSIVPTGSAGGIYSNALFAQAHGEATVFFPCEAKIRSMGRVIPLAVPGVELATLVHVGSHDNVDLAYGALAAYVTRHALAVEGPLREYYYVGPRDTSDMSAWRTEIGWPVFQMG
jgi:effector-binding domain-containing protein